MADQHFDEHVSEDNVVGQSSESTNVSNQHSDEGVSVADVESESLNSKGVIDKHSDEGETVAEVIYDEDKHSDKGERITEVVLESLKSEGDKDKHLNEDETIAEVALVADEHTDKSDRIAEVALESLKSDKRSDKGENIDEVALESLKSKSIADEHSNEGESIAEVAFETLKSKDLADKTSNEVSLESKISESVADKKLDEVALESMKSKGVTDKHSNEGESITEVAVETLKSMSVADNNSDEGVVTTNDTLKNSDSMEIIVKTLDSQLHNFIVDKKMPVSIFKETIASEVGLPVEQQRLIFRGKVLKDDDLLSEYHVESGHTLHLVDRQPTEFQVSSSSSNAAQDVNVTTARPHVGHSVVLGTIGGVRDQDDISNQDINQVIGAILNFIGTGGHGPIDITGTAQPQMQSQNRSPSQSMPVPAVPTLSTPITDSLHTLSEFMNHMDRALSQNDSTKDNPFEELPSNANGLPSPAALAAVMRHAQHLLSGPAVDSLSHTARRLEEDEGSSDVTVRTRIQTETMQSGLAMQHLGVLLLELGRTMLTLRIGQSPAESSVNAGPAVYISPSGPNPIMVQPFPLQTNSLFSGTSLNHGTFGPVGIGAVAPHVNIHIHPGVGPRATDEHDSGVSSQTSGVCDNMRSENQSSVGQVHAGLQEEACVNATSRMTASTGTEGSSSSSQRNIPIGLGPGALQPKRRQQQTRSDAGSTSHTNPSQQSSGGQLDPTTLMNQVGQNPALNNLLSGASNQNRTGSQDVFNNLMTQFTQNPEMMSTVNHLAQQMDSNQDLTSGSGGRILDMSTLVQQMMPFVSQSFNSGSSSSSSNKFQSVVRKKGILHKRSSSVKSLNTHERSSDFQMNLENAAQKIVEHYPPLEIFSSVVQTTAALRNNVYDTTAINELSMEEDLAQEFTEMLKRDISRRLQ